MTEQTSEGKKCDYCHKPGHTKEECRKYKSDLAAGGNKATGKGETKDGKGPICWNCEEVGHRRDKCPKPKTAALKGKGKD